MVFLDVVVNRLPQPPEGVIVWGFRLWDALADEKRAGLIRSCSCAGIDGEILAVGDMGMFAMRMAHPSFFCRVPDRSDQVKRFLDAVSARKGK